MSAARLPHLAPPVIERVRLTVPAREAIERGDGHAVHVDTTQGMGASLYDVTLVRPPRGLVYVLIGHGAEQHHGVRLDVEPEYPGEWPDGQGTSWWERGALVPCPTCGYALLWCEAGYVPGWRICLAGHASQLSADGRTAKRHARQDASTLAATRPIG